MPYRAKEHSHSHMWTWSLREATDPRNWGLFSLNSIVFRNKRGNTAHSLTLPSVPDAEHTPVRRQTSCPLGSQTSRRGRHQTKSGSGKAACSCALWRVLCASREVRRAQETRDKSWRRKKGGMAHCARLCHVWRPLCQVMTGFSKEQLQASSVERSSLQWVEEWQGGAGVARTFKGCGWKSKSRSWVGQRKFVTFSLFAFLRMLGGDDSPLQLLWQ